MRNLLKDKKGLIENPANVNILYPAVLSFILIGILLGIGLLVMAEVREQILLETDDDSAKDDNDTIVAGLISNKTPTQLIANSNSTTLKSVTINSVTNLSAAGPVVPTTFYNVTSTGRFMVIGLQYNATALNVTYTYTWTPFEVQYTALNDTEVATTKFVDFLPIIAISLAAAIIIAIVIGAFTARRIREKGY